MTTEKGLPGMALWSRSLMARLYTPACTSSRSTAYVPPPAAVRLPAEDTGPLTEKEKYTAPLTSEVAATTFPKLSRAVTMTWPASPAERDEMPVPLAVLLAAETAPGQAEERGSEQTKQLGHGALGSSLPAVPASPLFGLLLLLDLIVCTVSVLPNLFL